MTPRNPPGLDVTKLEEWFIRNVHERTAPLTANLIAGGRSNLTYEVFDGNSTWIVRRPPLGHVLATAHDMGREYRVMTALTPTSVPVPRTVAYCGDAAVLGSEFYVMERVVGTPYRFAREMAPLGATRTRNIALGLVDTLAALHAVDPAAVDLSGFGRTDGFLERQVRRWNKQLQGSYSRDLPAAWELHDRLQASVPKRSATSIVHGDYRLDNVLIGEDDRLNAVIDWEMATLGDPLTDLALLVTYQRLSSLLNSAPADAFTSPGFPKEDELVQRYAVRSGQDLSEFGFYLGLAAYKLAAILEGIHYRYLQGQTVGDGFERVGDAVAPLLEAGLTAMN